MKIKMNPVTNSSSLSFIIRNRKPIEIAKDMLRISFFNNREWASKRSTIELQSFDAHAEKVMNWIAENSDFEGNICIPFTTNYETFIYQDWFERCVVLTCNNEGWEAAGLKIDFHLGEGDNDLEEYSYQQVYLDLDDFQLKTKVDIEMVFWGASAATPEEAEKTRVSLYSQYDEWNEIAMKKLEKINEIQKKSSD